MKDKGMKDKDGGQKAKRWATTTEAGEFLGVHPRTVLRLINSGQLPAYRVGSGPRGKWHIQWFDLLAFLEFRSNLDRDEEPPKGQTRFEIVRGDEADGDEEGGHDEAE